jgi:hypothetical protein
MWFLCSFTVIIAAVQAVLFIRAANKATKECRIDPEIPKKAFRIGLVTAIGPALGVFIVMVGLMSAIGGPMSWLRLSIIGAAPTELAAATNGATAAGVTLGGEGYTLEILAVSWFAMALNGAGWLLVTGVATPSLEVLRDKLSGGDTQWLGYMSAACSIGVYGYLNINSIVSKGFLNGGPVISIGNLVAVVSGALCMMALGKWVTPKHPKLAEYSLGIAMLFGIACALILT